MMIDGTGARGAMRRSLIAGLMAGTAALAIPAGNGAMAQATAAAVITVNIPAQPLSNALVTFSRQTGIDVVISSKDAAGKRSTAVSEAVAPEAALRRLLTGTGLSYSFENGHTVAIGDRVAAADASVDAEGALVLGVIDVTAGSGNPVHAPYETAAPTSYIAAETIERFRGSSPADLFRASPGVMSGEARNGGAVDVNVRGMQGMGRVAVTVDGAENAVTVYQGYQGLSNRTYVDPDLLGGIDITKGSDAASSGIAGTVAMRTLNAGDIVEDGKTFGVRLKGGFGTNTSEPEAGARAGYSIRNTMAGYPVVTSSADGMDRPSRLEPTSGSGSIVAAYEDETFDFIAGYAYRKQGNYHAGTNGPSAEIVNKGPQPFCYSSGTCVPAFDYLDYAENSGLANFRAGEEVLNTQLETHSTIAKATVRLGDGHSLQFGYTGYRGEAGDLLASQLTTEASQSVQQAQTAGTSLDTGTLRYGWKPDGNPLVDLKADLWVTSLELRNPPRNAYGTQPETLGLAEDYRTGSDTLMWGASVANTSSFAGGYGDVDLTFGASFRSEDTSPSAYTDIIEGWLNLRDARRDEAAAYAKAAYKPLDWLTFTGGMRYAHFWSHDRRTQANSEQQLNPDPDRGDDGFSPFVGVAVKPFEGAEVYANYSKAMRFPSLFESVSAFTIIPNPDLTPEYSSNWEIGANLRKDGLFAEGGTGMLKLGYFNWDVTDYIARSFRAFEGEGYTWYGMQVYNIDRARFSGLELSARYEIGGFAAELGASYYLNVEFCQTAGVCEDKSMYGDYATNQVPPEYSVNLTVSQKLLEDTLTVGGRVTHVGPRAIGHGQVTDQGLSQFINQIDWEPYTLVDVFAEYDISKTLTAAFAVENVTDQYYVDPLGLVQIPGPGRTFRASLTAKF